jgi:hypothetical protein
MVPGLLRDRVFRRYWGAGTPLPRFRMPEPSTDAAPEDAAPEDAT